MSLRNTLRAVWQGQSEPGNGGEAKRAEGRLRAFAGHSEAFSFYSEPGGGAMR